MTRVTYSRLALEDVVKVLAYYRRVASDPVADAFADEMSARADLIRAIPDAGRAVDREGTRVSVLRRFPYVIFYKRFQDGEIRILRVRHGRRRPSYQ